MCCPVLALTARNHCHWPRELIPLVPHIGHELTGQLSVTLTGGVPRPRVFECGVHRHHPPAQQTSRCIQRCAIALSRLMGFALSDA